MSDPKPQDKRSIVRSFPSKLLVTSSLIGNILLASNAMAADVDTSPLATAVDSIIGVYPAPGSSDIDPNNATLIIQYPASADYEWTYQSALSIHDLDTGEQVYTIDPEKDHVQQGLTSFTVKLAAGILQQGKRYGVTVDPRFAVVSQAPWKSGAITEGLWTFSTSNPTPEELVNTVSPLTPAVDNIVGVYPASGSTNIDPANTTLVLKYADIADYEWTHNSALTIHNLDTGKQVFTVDPTESHPQQKLKHLTIPIDKGVLESGTRYAVTVDYRFAIVNKAPWKSGEISQGQWIFTTSGVSEAEQEEQTQAETPVALTPAVDNIEGVYPAPGSTDIDPNNTTLIIQYPASADYEWTYQSALTIKDLDTGEQVYSVDPEKDHVQQGLTSFTVKLADGVLQDAKRYGVTVDYRFAVVSQAPWKSGEVSEGQWTFETVGYSPNSGDETETDPNAGDTPDTGTETDVDPDPSTDPNPNTEPEPDNNPDSGEDTEIDSDNDNGGEFANRDPIANGQPNNPIMFVSQLPLAADFAASLATFANHIPGTQNAGRGGDLYIRYQDGSLKNLTRLAGFGEAGEAQRENAISVRDPSIHWDGTKALFSMVIGAPERYKRPDYYWQMYEVTGLGKDETPVITKLPNQPENNNNVGAVYGSDDRIIFASDRALNGQRHLYPQHDEYESTATLTGLFSLDPKTGDMFRMVDSPSGSFDPIIAQDGRVMMTQWDHLKRDQQADLDKEYEAKGIPLRNGTFNYSDESSSAYILGGLRTEFFPEPIDGEGHFVGNGMNVFLPWQIEQDGTEMEMINHVGRHELFSFIGKRVNNDPNVRDQSFTQGANKNRITNFFQMAEDPTNPGIFYGVDAGEFATLGSGQIVRLNGHESLHGNQMQIDYVTTRNSNSTEINPDDALANQGEGHYRDPLPMSNGQIVAVHTDVQGVLQNFGSVTAPNPNINYRLKFLAKGEDGHWRAEELVTSGIRRTVNYYSPDDLVVFNDVEMWEVQPVEVVARTRPYSRTVELPEPETAVFAEEDVSLDAVKAYLKANDLALVISRNLTARDENDKQQPYNLCVADTENPCNEDSTQTIGDDGRVYDISHLQFFQADRIRGIGGTVNPRPGRRVLAMPMHDSTAYNPVNTSGPEGSVKIAQDGSMAALVPARRAMSWQLTDEQGESIVAERFWVSFQPGEVRVCASCHGVNEQDQAQKPLATNKPEALRNMLTHIKSLIGSDNTQERGE